MSANGHADDADFVLDDGSHRAEFRRFRWREALEILRIASDLNRLPLLSLAWIQLTELRPWEYRMNNWVPSILSLGAALLLPACIVTDGERDSIGTLTVEWTIDGRRDPIDCAEFGVDRLEFVISDARGNLVEEVEPWCESFFVAVDLFEGRYFADATLVDSVDRSATLTLPIDAIDVIAGTDLVVGVDFPLGSFL